MKNRLNAMHCGLFYSIKHQGTKIFIFILFIFLQGPSEMFQGTEFWNYRFGHSKKKG